MCAKSPQLCPTICDPVDLARQAPLSMGFSRQDYWSGLPCPPPGNLSYPGVKPESLMSPALAGGFYERPLGRLTNTITSAQNIQKGEITVSYPD